MKELTVETLENYLYEIYKARGQEQSLFMKLVEEVGETAEVLNFRAGRKAGSITSDEELGIELADIIHYVFAIAAINQIDLAKIIVEKDEKAAIKYNHPFNLKEYMERA